MSLACPSCQTALRTTFYEGIAGNFCLECQGMFLPRDALQKILVNREAVIPRAASTNAPSRAAEIGRLCPACQVGMRKGQYGKVSKTTFDICPKCTSLWLDVGELEAMQRDYEFVEDNRKGVRAAAPDAAPLNLRATAFVCPKCAHPQAQTESCTRCGIVFEKFNSIQRERGQVARDEADNTARVDAVLKDMIGFEFTQKYHLTEVFLGFERANNYVLRAKPGSTTRGLWHLSETNRSGLSILGRNLFDLFYTFSMDLTDEDGRRVQNVERRTRLYFHAIDIYDENGRHLGSAVRRFSLFSRVIGIEDTQGRELMRLRSRFHQPWHFEVTAGGKRVGTFNKRWTGFLKEAYTDADRFELAFERDLAGSLKRLLLGTTALLDAIYFEGRQGYLGHFLNVPAVHFALLALFALAFLHDPSTATAIGFHP